MNKFEKILLTAIAMTLICLAFSLTGIIFHDTFINKGQYVTREEVHEIVDSVLIDIFD